MGSVKAGKNIRELEREVFVGLVGGCDVSCVSGAWKELNDSVHGFYFGVRQETNGGVKYCSIEDGLVNVANGLREGDVETWEKCLFAIGGSYVGHSSYDSKRFGELKMVVDMAPNNVCVAKYRDIIAEDAAAIDLFNRLGDRASPTSF